MKLKVRQTGVVLKELEVNIRNPSATMANVRAAIAILFKLDPHSFRMVRGAGSPSSEEVHRQLGESENELADDTALLASTGLKDGDSLVLVAKRSRDDAPALAAATPQPANIVVPPVVPGPEPDAPQRTTTAATDRPTVPQKRLRKGTVVSDRNTIPHTIHASDQEDRFLAERMEADNAEAAEHLDEGDIDDNDDDDDEDEENDDEEDEIQEMVSQLLSVPNILEMRQQFLLNPQAVLSQIQSDNPRLFQLIAAHNQEFLDLVENEALLEALREEREEVYIGDEEGEEGDEEEEYDEEDEAMMHEFILDALGAAAREEGLRVAARRGGAGNSAAGSAATTVTLGRNATQILDSLRSTGTADGTADSSVVAQQRDEGSSSTAAPTAAAPRRQRGSVPLVIAEGDQEKIDGLMQLGFTKEQCTSAYFACNRSIERAADMLFENPSQL